MSRTIPAFHAMLNMMGSDVTYHRETGGTVCPCVSPEGFRTPSWHVANPGAPVCNEEGRLASVIVNVLVKAAVQPATIARHGRSAERVVAVLGQVQRDDQVGIFPCVWNGTTLDFSTFSDSGDDYILYDGRRFMVVASDKLPDIDGNPNHHWEVGLRLIKNARPS